MAPIEIDVCTSMRFVHSATVHADCCICGYGYSEVPRTRDGYMRVVVDNSTTEVSYAIQ